MPHQHGRWQPAFSLNNFSTKLWASFGESVGSGVQVDDVNDVSVGSSGVGLVFAVAVFMLNVSVGEGVAFDEPHANPTKTEINSTVGKSKLRWFIVSPVYEL